MGHTQSQHDSVHVGTQAEGAETVEHIDARPQRVCPPRDCSLPWPSAQEMELMMLALRVTVRADMIPFGCLLQMSRASREWRREFSPECAPGMAVLKDLQLNKRKLSNLPGYMRLDPSFQHMHARVTSERQAKRTPFAQEVRRELERFVSDEHAMEMMAPVYLNAFQRKVVHVLSTELGLGHTTVERGTNPGDVPYKRAAGPDYYRGVPTMKPSRYSSVVGVGYVDGFFTNQVRAVLVYKHSCDGSAGEATNRTTSDCGEEASVMQLSDHWYQASPPQETRGQLRCLDVIIFILIMRV